MDKLQPRLLPTIPLIPESLILLRLYLKKER
jgi:hypothetical protein